VKKSEYMSRQAAREIRAAQLEGRPVSVMDAYRAIWTLLKRKDRLHLPRLSREVREKVNCILLFNLGLAIGARPSVSASAAFADMRRAGL
jgi:hypothetical protein